MKSRPILQVEKLSHRKLINLLKEVRKLRPNSPTLVTAINHHTHIASLLCEAKQVTHHVSVI